jgi:glucosamine--fructose-6-phosphate aminotransferase (isomerizing)
VGVASTKAFSTQVVTFLIMALHFGKKRNLDYRRYRDILSALEKLPNTVEGLLNTK